MDFSTLTGEQLREACAARQLPKSGTNPEMIDRLNAYEAQRIAAEGGDLDDLLAEAGGDPVAAPAVPGTPPVSTPPPAPAAVEPKADPRLLPGNRFEVTFPCPSELSDGVHQDNQLRARATAEEAGHYVRGGAYSAARVGWRTIQGIRHAVYEVHIRKE